MIFECVIIVAIAWFAVTQWAIFNNTEIIMGVVEDIQAAQAAAQTKLDLIAQAVAGIITYIQSLPSGATPEQLATILAGAQAISDHAGQVEAQAESVVPTQVP